LSNRPKHPPEWLVKLIGEEIRRGIRLLLKDHAPSGFVIDSIRLRLFLKGEWQETLFDGAGRLDAFRLASTIGEP
jgi:hypothetical protein